MNSSIIFICINCLVYGMLIDRAFRNNFHSFEWLLITTNTIGFLGNLLALLLR